MEFTHYYGKHRRKNLLTKKEKREMIVAIYFVGLTIGFSLGFSVCFFIYELKDKKKVKRIKIGDREVEYK